MLKSEINAILGKRQAGTFVRVAYVSDCDKDMSAKARFQWKVEKETIGSFRWGCEWQNTKAYKAQEAERIAKGAEVRKYTPWNEWETKRVYKRHLTTGRLYLSLMTMGNANAHSKYYLTDRTTGERKEVTKDEIISMGIMNKSFTSKKPSGTVLIPIENIHWIK